MDHCLSFQAENLSQRASSVRSTNDNTPQIGKPHICVTEGKQHIRRFLRDTLSEFGFTISECVDTLDLRTALDTRPPDFIVLGLTDDGGSVGAALGALADKDFAGKVLPVVRRDSAVIDDVEEFAERLGLALLPPLLTPFNDKRLRDSIAAMLPEASEGPVMDLSEALHSGWLELWYQPKIDARTLAMRGAEALLRIRHPVWGIVPPAYFIGDDGDPRSGLVSETVIDHAVDDWHHFFFERGAVELSINLPTSFLREPASLGCLRQKLPRHTAFEGLIVESNGVDILRNIEFFRDLAKELRGHKIAISIDDLGAEWCSFAGLKEFPFVEIKVDRKFVNGCATDGLKQSMCRSILKLADSYGARTVAEGVETWADFHAVREMGFDLIQGFLFAKPMSVESLTQSSWMASQS
jgi:EAL domain-containing protein (putative c-di-GMP-specific phosphodiesterase class I)